MKDLKKYLPPAAMIALAAAAVVVACAEGDPGAPGTVTDLHYFQRADALVWNGHVSIGDTAGLADTRLLAFRAPGDDGFSGEAAQYDVRFFLASDLGKNGVPADGAAALRSDWDGARRLAGEPDPGRGGHLAQLFLPRINPGETVWFAMTARDEVGQESGVSNVAGPVHLATIMVPVRPAPGDTAEAGFGETLAGIGDANHDGHSDMLLGSPLLGTASLVLGLPATSLIVLGPNAGGAVVRHAVPELTAHTTIVGDPADQFGAAVAGIGSVNGDGFSDYAVGAPAYNPGSTVQAGAIFIQYGAATTPATLAASSVSAIIKGDSTPDRLGQALAGAGDINGDGRPELLAGAPGAFSSGALYVFTYQNVAAQDAAAASVIIKGEAAGDAFGAVVKSIGDINGDGIQDLAVAAPLHNASAGAVYVFYGGDAGVAKFNAVASGQTVIDLSAAKADITIRGTFAGRMFGEQIAAGGNLAGDSDYKSDFAVTGGDTVYVFFGSSYPATGSSVGISDVNAAAKLTGAPGAQFGAALIGGIDFDRDGHHDLAVAAPGAGAIYVFNGPITSASAPRFTLAAPAAGQNFAAAAALIGDLNGDLYPDLIIAAPDAGQSYIAF